MDYLTQVAQYNKYTDIRYIKFTISGRIAGADVGPQEEILKHLIIPPHENLEVRYSDLVKSHSLFLYMQAELQSKAQIKKQFELLYDYQQPYSGVLTIVAATGVEHHIFDSVVPGMFRVHTHPAAGMLSYSIVYNVHDMVTKKEAEPTSTNVMEMLELD